MDIGERIEVLEGMLFTLESRLLAVRTAPHVLDHAARIEQRAMELLQQAEKIRQNLRDDTDNVVSIYRDYCRHEAELIACKALRMGGMPYSATLIDKWVRDYLKAKGL